MALMGSPSRVGGGTFINALTVQSAAFLSPVRVARTMPDFTDREKLDAIEVEIVRRKRMFGASIAEPHKYRQVAVLKAIAEDYREKLEPMEKTDDNRIPPRVARGLARDA